MEIQSAVSESLEGSLLAQLLMGCKLFPIVLVQVTRMCEPEETVSLNTKVALANTVPAVEPRMDVVAMLDFLGLKEADLSRQLTFKAAEGEGPQNLVAHAVYEGT